MTETISPPGKSQYQIHQTVVKCVLCGKDNAQPHYKIRASDFLAKQPGARVDDENAIATLVKCQDCGLVYVNPRWVFPEGLMPYDEEAEDQYFAATYAERKRAYQELAGGPPGWLHRQVQKVLDVG